MKVHQGVWLTYLANIILSHTRLASAVPRKEDQLPFLFKSNPSQGIVSIASKSIGHRSEIYSLSHLMRSFIRSFFFKDDHAIRNENLLRECKFKNCGNRLPWWLRWLRVCLQCRRPGFDTWVRKIPWRREWLPTPVFLPGVFHGQRSLAGCSPWHWEESNTTKELTLNSMVHTFKIICMAEANTIL